MTITIRQRLELGRLFGRWLGEHFDVKAPEVRAHPDEDSVTITVREGKDGVEFFHGVEFLVAATGDIAPLSVSDYGGYWNGWGEAVASAWRIQTSVMLRIIASKRMSADA